MAAWISELMPSAKPVARTGIETIQDAVPVAFDGQGEGLHLRHPRVARPAVSPARQDFGVCPVRGVVKDVAQAFLEFPGLDCLAGRTDQAMHWVELLSAPGTRQIRLSPMPGISATRATGIAWHNRMISASISWVKPDCGRAHGGSTCRVLPHWRQRTRGVWACR